MESDTATIVGNPFGTAATINNLLLLLHENIHVDSPQLYFL